MFIYNLFISKEVNLYQAFNGEPLPLIDWTIATDDTEFLTINLDSPLTSGQEYHIDIKYVGILNNDGIGFFRNPYTDENQNLRLIKIHQYINYNLFINFRFQATTQFQSVNARFAFPCFDEPSRKATFTIALGHDPEFSAIANMPIESSYPGEE